MIQGRKIYLQPSNIVHNGMCDLVDTQRGNEIENNQNQNTLNFFARMFDMEWKLYFSTTAIDRSRCEVIIQIEPKEPDEEVPEVLRSLADCVLRREFAMLDAMLLIGTPCEATYGNGGDVID